MVTTEEEADDVYDQNDEWSLARIRSEAKKIEETGGGITEYQLRRNRVRRQLQLENSGNFADSNKAKASHVWLG